jgi:hypothetical protein
VSMAKYNSASIENAVKSGIELGEELCV